MPLDPTISLHAGEGVAPMQGPNLGMLGQFAQIQNALNQNRLFQQTFAARMRMGEIMASSPNLDSAMQTALQDPIAAPFAPQILNTVRQTELTMLQMQGEQQKQAQSGMEAVFKALPAIYNNPTNNQWQTSMSAALAPLSDTARQRVAPAIESIRMGLLDGISPDQGQAAAQIRQRVGALMLQSNMTPDSIRAVTGVPAPQPVQGPFGPGGATTLTTFGGAAVPLAGGSPAGGVAGTLAAGGGVPSVGGTGLVGPTMEEQAAYKSMGEKVGDLQEEMANRAQTLPDALKRIDMMTSAMGQFDMGGGANFRMQVGKLMQAFGASQDAVDKVSNSSLPATQIFNAEVKPLMVQELKQVAQGTGRVMRSEVDTFLHLLDATTDPRAALAILNQARYGLQVGYDQSQKFVDFKQALAKKDPSVAGLNIMDFPAYYAKNFSPKTLPTSNAAGGMNLGPANVVGPTQNALTQPQPQVPPTLQARPPLSSFEK